MRGLKFSTVVNATGVAILVKGKDRALSDVLLDAYGRLRRVSGMRGRLDCFRSVEVLPRTGDNIRMRVTWTKNAHA